jgi:hypothetical protein
MGPIPLIPDDASVPSSEIALFPMERKQPSRLATILGHVIVGVSTAWLVGRLTKSPSRRLVVGVSLAIAHVALDAPVSQALSDLGI